MIKIYKKKPVEVQACKWTGKNKDELIDFAGDSVSFLEIQRAEGITTSCSINTNEGRMDAKIGDYIIKGIKGEFYPCDNEIFKKTYEEVSNRCPYYEHSTREKPVYDSNTGSVRYHTTVHYGICNGTKEREECRCGADKTKCDFYKN